MYIIYFFICCLYTVVKRSISNGIFGQFAGKSIIEFDILNLNDVSEYNKKSSQN